MMKIVFDRKVITLAAALAGSFLLLIIAVMMCHPVLTTIGLSEQQEKTYAQENSFARNLIKAKNTSGIIGQLVPKQNIPLVVEAVNKLAQKNDISLVLVQPPLVDQQTKEFFHRVRWEVQTGASLKDLGVFMTEVRNMPEGLVDIEALRVWPADDKEGGINAKITFLLFVAKDNGQK
ncbi:MAG: type 4a pilus biogenesis protein PilO [Candidatus Omnitrophica bacterium]|nr:type 4a pilus biogenesis protein PilO [Candidatus Omnitrophota bacterium]